MQENSKGMPSQDCARRETAKGCPPRIVHAGNLQKDALPGSCMQDIPKGMSSQVPACRNFPKGCPPRILHAAKFPKECPPRILHAWNFQKDALPGLCKQGISKRLPSQDHSCREFPKGCPPSFLHAGKRIPYIFRGAMRGMYQATENGLVLESASTFLSLLENWAAVPVLEVTGSGNPGWTSIFR
jgi:hypothetical protein